MIILKLVLSTSPIIVASILFFTNPAAALTVDSASATTHVNSTSTQAVHGWVNLNQVDRSNPIIDHLSCKCAYCAGVQSPLQGKLPISSIL